MNNRIAIIVAMCMLAGPFAAYGVQSSARAAAATSGAPAAPAAAPADPAAAAPSTWDNIKVWFQHWKEGLASSAVEGQYQQRSLTAVAAVRGNDQKLDNPNKPYIKGRTEDRLARKLKKERAELSKAVDLILAGKVDEGSKMLDEFEAKHPKSPLMADVRKAREKLQDLKSAPTQAAQSPAQK